MKLCSLSLCFAALALTCAAAQFTRAETPQPPLTHNEVLSLFRERSTPDEIARFRELSSANDHHSQTQALQIVLFKLTDYEMFRIGVTSVNHSEWAVAWSTDSKADMSAIQKALKPLGISPGGVFGLQHGGWYVPREKFFAAQRALKENREVQRLGITVVEPKFRLQANKE